MSLNLTVESFLQVVRQSGLIDTNQLPTLLSKYADRGIDIKKSQAIADALMADDLLTKWQAEKLLNGKHKGFVLGKYRLLGLLGKGGMSSVYLAEHILMKRRCAIKVLPAARVNDSSYLARFHREAQAVASVDHPNIVRAYDVDCAQDKDAQIHFLVMEYVPGQSLQELVMQDGPLDYTLAMDFIRQSGLGLDHAHRAGMVHRDIKPANLLIDTSGVIKILDMGLARFFDDRETSSLTIAHEEKVLGTADYLAPEQAMDSHSVDTRADIYSLGCSLYFLLTGKPPYDEGTLTQRLMWHQTKSFPPLTDSRLDCPASLIAILNKMVEKKPDDRYQTGNDVAAACQEWLVKNGGAEWRQRIGNTLREVETGSRPGLLSRERLPTRDLQSDSEIVRHEPDDAPPTRISPRPPSTKISNLPPPTAARTAPVAPPVAQPVKPASPPVAKPVLPVGMPVAAPAIPVAKLVVAIAQPVAPIRPPVAQQDDVSEDDVTEDEVQEDGVPESSGDDDGIFSLFGQESSSAIGPDTKPLDDAAANTMTAFATDETEPATSAKSSSGIKRSASSTKLPSTISATSKKLQAIKWQKPKVLVVGSVALSLLIGTGVWLSISSSKPNVKKKPSGKNAVTQPAKDEAFEVTLQVGSTSEYTTIGRALHTIIENHTDYESKAKGKLLRFILQVAANKSYDESVTIDESFPGELRLTANGSTRPKLQPAGDEPAISVRNRAGVTIEGLSIALNQFAATSRGVVISGNSPKCRIKNCLISNIGQAGVEVMEVAGAEAGEGIMIEGLTFQNAGSGSFGVLISGKEASRHVTVQRCKFVGPMGAAIAVQAPVESLAIRQCAVSGATTAVRFAEAVLLKEVVIEHCSFKLTKQSMAGLLFDAMPADGSSGFSCRNNLFAGQKPPEVLIEKNYDPKKFDQLISTDKPSDNNWSDRAIPAKAAINERDMIEQRVPVIEFADASKSSSDLYLVPKAGVEYKSAGVKAK